MSIFDSIWNTTKTIAFILKREDKQKIVLLLTYLKLKFKYLLFIKIMKLNISKENIFGFTVSFFNYNSFIFMFEEIFINKDYYFTSKKINPLIIDCGSNIGMTLLFFKKVYPDSTIIAFEPDIRTFQILKKNIEMNNLKNIELINKAVYNNGEILDFYYDPDYPGSSMMSTIRERLPKTHSRVQSVLLSDFIEQQVDFLKIDIEGAEYCVIEELSLKNKLKKIRETCIEYHHHIKPTDDEFSKILKILEENGFGYQISAYLRPPFNKEEFQDILIYAYQKDN